MSASQPPAETPIEVRLTIERDSAPIAGELRVGDHAPRPFWSWLDLIAAIEAATRGENP